MSERKQGQKEGGKIRGGEGGRGGRGQCAEGDHNWPGSGRWCGAVAGWNMCVWGVGLWGVCRGQ